MSNVWADSGHLVNDYDYRFAATVAFYNEHLKRVAVGC
jgi:hypothetical protein